MTVELKSKLKYREGFKYKNQKSTSGNAGKSNKKGNNTAARRNTVVIHGNAVMLCDMSGVRKYCKATGRVLPIRGMAWQIHDDVFIDRRVAQEWANRG